MLGTSPLERLLSEFDAVDLSQTLEEGIPNFPTHSRYYHELWESYWQGTSRSHTS
jgi:hypothetical protein